MKNKDLTKIILILLFLASLTIVTYSIMTYGQAIIYGDTATASLLAKSIKEHNNLIPSSWYYANNEIWTLGVHLPVLITSSIIKNQALARVTGSTIWVLSIAILVCIISKKLWRDYTGILAIPIIYVMMFGTRDMNLYEAAYIGILAFDLLACFTFYNAVKKWNLWIMPWLILIIILMIGSVRYAAEITCPILGAAFLFQWRQDEKEDSIVKLWKSLLISILPTVLGYVLHRLAWKSAYRYPGMYSMGTAFKFKNPVEGVLATVVNLYKCFGIFQTDRVLSVEFAQNVIAAILTTLCCLILPVLQFIKLNQEPEETRFFFTYAMLHNALFLFLSIFAGFHSAYRYMLSSCYLFVLVSAHYICKYWLSKKSRIVILSAFAMALLISALGIGLRTRNWQEGVAERRRLGNLLQQENITKLFCRYGDVATEIYTNYEIVCAPVNCRIDGISSFRWLVDGEVFNESDKDIKSALFLRENLEEEQLIKQFGVADKKILYDGINIYIYNHDIAPNILYGEWME